MAKALNSKLKRKSKKTELIKGSAAGSQKIIFYQSRLAGYLRVFAIMFFLSFFFIPAELAAAKAIEGVVFSGPCYFRLPGYHSFVLQDGIDSVLKGTLITVRPDVNSPTATESKLLQASYTVTLLPGASLKVTQRGFVPLTGRFIFAGEGEEAMIFVTRSFELHYRKGRLLLEITPDEGTFMALRNKGNVFVKALNRQVYDLEPGHEVHFPLFKPAKLKKRLSGFWDDPPTGFSSARRRSDLASMPESEDEDSEEESGEIADGDEADKDTDNKAKGDEEAKIDNEEVENEMIDQNASDEESRAQESVGKNNQQ